MSRRRTRAVLLAAAALAAAAAVAWAFSRPEAFWFDEPAARLARGAARFHEELCAEQGIRALWTFDERDGGAWFAGAARARAEGLSGGAGDPDGPAFPGTVRVPGRHGSARRFSGEDGAFVLAGRDWHHGPSEPFSVAMWLRLRDHPARQDVLCTESRGRWGLRAEDGRIAFDYRTPEGDRAIAAPFGRDGRWRHVAVVADPSPDGGSIRLFLDGAPAAEEPLAALLPFDWPLAFGAATEGRVRDPLRGDVDDAALWDRALSPAEVRAAAGSSRGLAETFATRRARGRLARLRAKAALLAAAGRVFARGGGSARAGAEPPVLSLRLARGDLRRLLRAHERARRSGCLTDGAVRAADGWLTSGGRTVRCRVSLHGAPSFYPESPRPAFVLDPAEPGGAFPCGARRLVVAPPESCGGLLPLAGALVAEATGLPVAPACSAVSFRLNGEDRGPRLLRDFSRMGGDARPELAPEDFRPRRNAASVVRSERALVAPDDLPPAVAAVARAFLPPEARADISARLAEAAARFGADPRSPLPPARRRALLAAARERWDALPPGPPSAGDAPLDAMLLRGANVSPDRVVADLPLARLAASAAPGATLRFRSLAPDLLDDAGRVVGRPADAPRAAEIEAVWRAPDGSERAETLRFRVMPERIRLPTLSIWTGACQDRTWRHDAAAAWLEPGAATNAPARFLLATAAGGGGLRFRGNSSFETSRKPLLLKTDAPHGVLGAGDPGRALVVAGGFADRTLACNAFAFDLHRSFPRADGGTNLAPRVRRAEVFLNGRYVGLRECIGRVDRTLPGCGDATFLRHPILSSGFSMLPVHAPSRGAEAAALAALRDAEALVADPSVAGWAERVAARIDLDRAIDLFLLSDLLGNMNGFPRHYPFDEILRLDPATGRFDYVPWDFDYVLRDAVRGSGTDSDRRFVRQLPGYRERVAARWRELRAGPCSDAALLARFDALTDETAGYLAFDRGLLLPGETDLRAALDARRRECRELLLARAARLDRDFPVESPSQR